VNRKKPFTVVILQPAYLPWLGYFDQMFKSDAFVVYDDVQFDKHGWRNRNRIKTAHGWQWLTVPVLTKGRNKQSNKEVLINNNENWPKKHLASLKQNYSTAPFFHEYFSVLAAVYAKEWKFLIDLDAAFLNEVMRILGLERPVYYASDLGIHGGPTDRLISLCKHFGATRFLEGDAGKAYIEESRFHASDIELKYHGYRHPVYGQRYGSFVPYMSVIDLLFNQGPKSLEILVDVSGDASLEVT